MHLLIRSLFPRTKIRTVQSGVRARISVAISTEAKLLSILVVLRWLALYSDSDEILSLGFLTTVYPDEEQRAAEQKQAGASG